MPGEDGQGSTDRVSIELDCQWVIRQLDDRFRPVRLQGKVMKSSEIRGMRPGIYWFYCGFLRFTNSERRAIRPGSSQEAGGQITTQYILSRNPPQPEQFAGHIRQFLDRMMRSRYFGSRHQRICSPSPCGSFGSVAKYYQLVRIGER